MARPRPLSYLRALLQQRDTFLLNQLLKDVSRSFYLSLFILPRKVRSQIGLAYLFCRAADTIVDTELFASSEQPQVLELFRRQFRLDSSSLQEIGQIKAAIICSSAANRAEYALLNQLTDCFALLMTFPSADRHLICELVLTLTQGMQMDLRYFPSASPHTVQALPDLTTLKRYTYYVAGIVGEFWTKIHTMHLGSWPAEELQTRCAWGIGFGQGLQMTNILKDLGRDLSKGRCYLPQALLECLDIRVSELLQPNVLQQVRPLILALIWYTLDHLEHGYHYVCAIPKLNLRSRLSCMWPLLFAIQTLAVIWQTDNSLSPTVRIKISRAAVYRTMFISLGCLILPTLFRRYYYYLRQALISSLPSYHGSAVYSSHSGTLSDSNSPKSTRIG